MHAERDDQIAKRRRGSPVVAVLVLGGIVGLLVAVYLSRDGVVSQQVLNVMGPRPMSSSPTQASVPAAGQVQRATPGAVQEAVAPLPEAQPVPLPALDASDVPVKEALAEVVGAEGADWEKQLVPEQVLRRCVIFVVNLAEGKVDHKSSPLAPPAGAFRVEGHFITAETYARYDAPLGLVTQVPPERMAAMYRRYYPLLQAAYDELGERKHFHPILLRAIDVLLVAPELVEEPAVEPLKANLYRFSDPVLEALPPAHKQMLRLGRENAQALKVWLRQFRAAVVATTKA